MDLVVDGKVFNTNNDIVPGELEFDNLYPLANEDFVKTMEFDKATLPTENNNIGGDSN